MTERGFKMLDRNGKCLVTSSDGCGQFIQLPTEALDAERFEEMLRRGVRVFWLSSGAWHHPYMEKFTVEKPTIQMTLDGSRFIDGAIEYYYLDGSTSDDHNGSFFYADYNLIPGHSDHGVFLSRDDCQLFTMGRVGALRALERGQLCPPGGFRILGFTYEEETSHPANDESLFQEGKRAMDL